MAAYRRCPCEREENKRKGSMMMRMMMVPAEAERGPRDPLSSVELYCNV